MRRAIGLSICLLMSAMVSAQTQQGIVKTRGRMVNGTLQPGIGLTGATVYLNDRNVVSKDEKGKKGVFSFPVIGSHYLVKGVSKQGYQLVDMQVCREYYYSYNPLYIVMETPEQQQSDLLAKERSLRRNLQRRLQQREDEIEKLSLSLQEKNSLLQEINQQRDENEKIIKDLAQYYSTLDYDRLDDFQKQVSVLLENSELEKADSMLRLRGNIEDRIKEVLREQRAEIREDSILAQRQRNNEASKAGTKRKIEDIATDCNNFHLRFSQDHKTDSAAHYLELRAALDTTNIEWQNDAGLYICDYIGDYQRAMAYFERVLHQSLLQYGEDSEITGNAYDNIGLSFHYQGNYIKALEYYFKALAVCKKVFGLEHTNTAKCYNNIATVNHDRGDYPKSLEYHYKALAIVEKECGLEHMDVARSYNNIGLVYDHQGDYSKALEYYFKAMSIFEKDGSNNLFIATTYNNIGGIYKNLEDFPKALEFHFKALSIREEILGAEHPETAGSYINIGLVYRNLGDSMKALDYYFKAMNVFEKKLGFEHPLRQSPTTMSVLFMMI